MGRVRDTLSRAGRAMAERLGSDGHGERDVQTRLLWERLDQLDDRLSELETMVRRLAAASGGGVVSRADMTIADIRAAHPDAQTVLDRHHLGGCASCAVAEFETLQQGAELHDVDVDEVLRELDGLVST